MCLRNRKEKLISASRLTRTRLEAEAEAKAVAKAEVEEGLEEARD